MKNKNIMRALSERERTSRPIRTTYLKSKLRTLSKKYILQNRLRSIAEEAQRSGELANIRNFSERVFRFASRRR
jgi:hypothetical protein